MSDPQTFEELRRMARELPKNVLVPAHHIHSLLDETERLVERVTHIQLNLSEAQIEVANRAHSEEQYRIQIADLQRQIAEEKEKLTEAKADILEHHLQDEECRKAAGEFDKSDSFGIESPLYIIERMKAEIEAMRPIVDAARYHERSVTFYSHGTSSDPYHCDVCRAYKVYEARKQP